MHLIGSIDPSTIKNLCPHKIFLITDEKIKTLYGNDLAQALGAKIISIPQGEKQKTWQGCEQIFQELFSCGCGKDSTIIALGGGVITDLSGFIASITMRGLPLILIPTTLLGMVDASIGGKTALDTPFGKNLLGTTYEPTAVFIDPIFLENLPAEEKENGLVEIRKLGLVFDASLWDAPLTIDLIKQAIQAKISIVSEDLKEKGRRRILNFGHTIGHALEKTVDYQLSHGKAVAIGSVAAAHLSMRLGYLSSTEFDKIRSAFASVRLPQSYTRVALLQAMRHDKKNLRGELHFVLIDRIGRAIAFDSTYTRAVSIEELTPTLDWMEQCFK